MKVTSLWEVLGLNETTLNTELARPDLCNDVCINLSSHWNVHGQNLCTVILYNRHISVSEDESTCTDCIVLLEMNVYCTI